MDSLQIYHDCILNQMSNNTEKNHVNTTVSSLVGEALNHGYENIEKPNDQFRCSVIPCVHSADTQEWRKKLIMAAEHNIVISGNFCGGEAFDDLLHLIESRMDEVPNLQVVIIGHPMFIKNSPDHPTLPHQNLELIEKLNKKFPSRFSFVSSPDGYYGTKKITNHTKCTIIDYGKYYIQGGSGIKDNFAMTGTDTLTKEEFLAQERGYLVTDSTHENAFINTGKNLQGAEEGSSIKNMTGGSFLDRLFPADFRDQDFVFRCSDADTESGRKMYQEALYLAYKWDQHGKNKGYLGRYLPPQSWELDDLAYQYQMDALFCEYPALSPIPTATPAIEDGDSALYRMLKAPIPDLSTIKTSVVKFDNSPYQVHDVSVRLFFTGPEQDVNPFEKRMIEKIDQATDKIILDQMYFQPSDALMNALIRAAKRGIKITILSNGMTENSPLTHAFFGPRNRYNYYYLISSLPEELKKNIVVYEYGEVNKGNHKKVTIVDNSIFAGSSNMGYKSLVLMGDHEMNFEAQSRELVEQTIERVINDDIRFSILLENPENISFLTKMRAAFHSFGARIWG